MKSKKWLATAAAAVILIGTLLAGTLAYFQDTDTATNTFTTGKVKIELNEPEWDDLEPEDKILVPGRVIPKDPTVTVKANSEDSYIRLQVNIPAALAALIEDLVIHPDYTFSGGYYYYDNMVPKATTATALPPLFTHVNVKDTVTNDDLDALTSADLDIVIHAHAMQAEGFSDAMDAFASFTP